MAVQNRFVSMSDVPPSSPLSERMSKDLRKRGLRFVGPTICYALMQAAGLVNDHLVHCPRHDACAALASA
ncbi:MAG: DNA-3-methyladenine glycosylase I [Pseudomonadales bacterium]|nr:DNA-3-methyladenine glycosylase I [Pseudomonadales bacterium]